MLSGISFIVKSIFHCQIDKEFYHDTHSHGNLTVIIVNNISNIPYH